MTIARNILSFVTTWFIPMGWQETTKRIIKQLFAEQIKKIRAREEEREEKELRLRASSTPYDYAQNTELRNKHAGEDLFILCTGPSLKNIDLRPLIGKTCMSVSNFYKHELYSQINPKYHVTPNVSLDNLAKANPDPEATLNRWFEEMDRSTGDTQLFFGSRQIDFIAQRNLFRHHSVRYLHMDHPNQIPGNNNIDIARTICPVQSVPILCLILGIYMGFKKIYLLGVDHDELRAQKYEYFFDRKLMAFKDLSVAENNSLQSSHYELLKGYVFLWEQYLGIAKVAIAENIQIINLNPESFLDVFPKAKLSSEIFH